ncbi:dCTP deaminase [Bosea massiliensis]|uniref:dCTP deaminase n=1 Tax=Bosea massiliensis TaxID=151419 RepID=A0ABW0PEV3_9HYPH
MILPAQTIRALCSPPSRPGGIPSLIYPFSERAKLYGMTYGLGPAGYDARIDQDFTLWPKQFRLASTMERFCLPRDLTFKVEDKSSLARRGLSLFNTTAEPGWEGFLTLELVNHSWRPIRFKRGMPIAQIVFHRLEAETDAPYMGRYQFQEAGPQAARLEL